MKSRWGLKQGAKNWRNVYLFTKDREQEKVIRNR
jgi:hypothetical protein